MHPLWGRPDTIGSLTVPDTIRKVPPWTTLLGVALFGLALYWLRHVLAQYRLQDIVSFGERQSLQRTIDSVRSLYRFFSQIEPKCLRKNRP